MSHKQWEVNCMVRKLLALSWIDVDNLLVNTVKDTVFIKGKLRFRGRLVRIEDEPAVTDKLREVERGVLAIEGMSRLRWELEGWRQEEGGWKAVS